MSAWLAFVFQIASFISIDLPAAWLLGPWGLWVMCWLLRGNRKVVEEEVGGVDDIADPQIMCPLSSMPPVFPYGGPLVAREEQEVNLLVVSALKILKAPCGLQR